MARWPSPLATRRNRLALLALVAVVALRALLPFAIERAIEAQGESATGLAVEVANVDLGVLRGAAAIEGLTVAGVGAAPDEQGAIDASRALFRLGGASVNLEWTALLRGRVEVSELAFAAPAVRVELDERGQPILPEPPPDAEEVPAETAQATEEAPAETAQAAEEAPAETAQAAEEARAETEPSEEASGSGWPLVVRTLDADDIGLTLHDRTLGEAVAELRLQRFSLADLGFADGAISLGGVGIQRPEVRVRRDYVLGSGGEPSDSEAEVAEAAAPAESAAAHRIDRIQLDRADFTLLTEAGPLDLWIRLDARDVSTQPGARFPVELEMGIQEGTVGLRGTVAVDGPAYAGRVEWNALPLERMTLAADPTRAAWLRSASTSGGLDVEFAGGPAGHVRASGALSLDGFHFEDPEERELRARLGSLAIALDRADVPLGDGAPTVEIGKLTIEQPELRYARPSPALDAFLSAGEAGDGSAGLEANPPAEETPGPAPRIRVKQIALRDGDLRFRDGTTRPVYQGRVSRLAGTLADVELPEGRAQLDLSGRAPGGSPFRLAGRYGGRTDLAFELRKLGLAQFNPYAVPASGYRLDQGTASLETRVRDRGQKLDVANDLVLHQLGLSPVGDRVLDDVIGVPVDLALAMLRDLAGDISLGIPLAVGDDGVRVGIGTVLRDALRAAIAGAITSPFKLAGAALTLVDGQVRLPPIEMEPGHARTRAGQDDTVQVLLELLASRPGLALTLEGSTSSDERDALALRILAERAAAGEDLPDVEDEGFLARRRVRGELERRAEGREGELRPGDQALLGRYVAALEVPPARYAALAAERAAGARDFLVEQHGVDAARLIVKEEAGEGEAAVTVGFQALPGGA